MRPLTRSCFLLDVLGKLFLLALSFLLGIFLCSPWSPPFPPYALTLISFFLAKVRRSLTLTLSPLMIWYSRQMALTYLPTALSVALRPLFPSQQAQFVQVSLLKPAPICMLFAGLGSTITSGISLLFSDLTLVLSSPPSFLLPETLWKICLLSLPVLSGCNGFPDARFSRGTTRLVS